MSSFSTTTKHALRWLTGSSNVSDIDAGFQALAEDLDGKIAVADKGSLSARPVSTFATPGKSGRLWYSTDTAVPSFDTGTGWFEIAQRAVTSKPTSPVDGQIWVAGRAGGINNGTNWVFRYNAGSSSPYKWECIGGLPYIVVAGAISATGATGYRAGAQILAPYAGDYDVVSEASVGATAVSSVYLCGGSTSAAPPADANATQAGIPSGGLLVALTNRVRLTGIGAGEAISAWVRSDVGGAGSTSAARTTVAALPIRVA